MQETSLSKIRLLYVEDDESIRDELIELLEGECLELIIAVDGEDGLQKYKDSNPDMILSDIRMPNMDGIKMSSIIRKGDENIPIIVSSAFSDSSYLLESISVGVNGYLLKPINLDKLFSVLEQKAESIVAKRSLKENQQLLSQYKEVVDASAIVSKTNTDGIITYVNDAFVSISGYKREELIGRNHNVLRHKDMKSSIFKDLWDTILSKKRWNGIVKNRAKDGSTYIVDSTIIPIINLSGDIVEFISIRKDITKLELQKEDLKHYLEHSSKFINEFEKALEENTLFCRTNTDGTITMVSEQFKNLLGYELRELVGSDYRKLIKNDANIQAQNDILLSIQNGEAWQGLIEHNTKDNRVVYLESSFIPIIGLNNKIDDVFCFFVDISDSIELNKEIVATQREVISTMGAIGETRSKETGDHVRRVAEYSKLLALKVGLTNEEAEELKMASPMHDIGKVGIPDSILNKPGKLTEEEFEVMKTHSELGFEMLRHSKQKLLNIASTVAYEHHEKWNGTGYPNKKSGEDIHIYGRITAIADVFDALGHDRVYKKAWPLEKILKLFEDERGKHFDPSLIDLFMNNLDDFLDIKNSFDKGLSDQ